MNTPSNLKDRIPAIAVFLIAAIVAVVSFAFAYTALAFGTLWLVPIILLSLPIFFVGGEVWEGKRWARLPSGLIIASACYAFPLTPILGAIAIFFLCWQDRSSMNTWARWLVTLCALAVMGGGFAYWHNFRAVPLIPSSSASISSQDNDAIYWSVARELKSPYACYLVDPTAYVINVSSNLNDPAKGKDIYYARSACFMDTAILSKDASWCDHVLSAGKLRNETTIFDGSAIDPNACREAVNAGKPFSYVVNPASDAEGETGKDGHYRIFMQKIGYGVPDLVAALQPEYKNDPDFQTDLRENHFDGWKWWQLFFEKVRDIPAFQERLRNLAPS